MAQLCVGWIKVTLDETTEGFGLRLGFLRSKEHSTQARWTSRDGSSIYSSRAQPGENHILIAPEECELLMQSPGDIKLILMRYDLGRERRLADYEGVVFPDYEAEVVLEENDLKQQIQVLEEQKESDSAAVKRGRVS